MTAKRVLTEEERSAMAERARQRWQNAEYRALVSEGIRASWQRPEVQKAHHKGERLVIPVCGIYKIENLINGKCYVGSSIDIRDRWRDHRLELRNNCHDSKHMQAAWNLYGEEAFAFEILEIVPDSSDLLTKEQYWIDTLGAYADGYNLTPVAGSRLGSIVSEETRRKIGESGKGLHAGEKSAHAKLTDVEVSTIKERMVRGENDQSIASDYGVSKRAIQFIRVGTHWAHIPWPDGLSADELLALQPKSVVGSNNVLAKLTEDQVAIIKDRLVRGDEHYVIAADFGVSRPAISAINRDLRWAHVPWPIEHKARKLLTEHDVSEIRKRLANGASYREIQDDYGIQDSAVSRIATGKRWPNVLPAE